MQSKAREHPMDGALPTHIWETLIRLSELWSREEEEEEGNKVGRHMGRS